MKDGGNEAQQGGEQRGEITEHEVMEVARNYLIQANTTGKTLGQLTVAEKDKVIKEARKQIGKRLREEVKNSNADGSYSRKYLVLFQAANRIDLHLDLNDEGVDAGGASSFPGATLGPDGRAKSRKSFGNFWGKKDE